MDKMSIGVGMVVGATLVVSGYVWSHEKSADGRLEGARTVEMATAVTVTVDQAIKTALANFPGRVVEAGLKMRHDKEAARGGTVWLVEIVTPEQDLMAVRIDARSGSVIDTEEKLIAKRRTAESKTETKPPRES